MAKIRALGTTITFNTKAVGALTSIGELAVTSDEIDKTTLDSANGYREFFQGFKDSGELPLTATMTRTTTDRLKSLPSLRQAKRKPVKSLSPAAAAGRLSVLSSRATPSAPLMWTALSGSGATLRISRRCHTYRLIGGD